VEEWGSFQTMEGSKDKRLENHLKIQGNEKKSWQIELRNWTCYSRLLIKQVEELFVPILELVAKFEWEQEEHNEMKACWRLVVVVELFEVKSRQA